MAKESIKGTKDKVARVPLSTIRRLPHYLRILYKMKELGRESVSSDLLAQQFNGTASQVRQDLRYFGPLGSSRNGYQIDTLIRICEKVLGISNQNNNCIVVGYGNLGRALAHQSSVLAKGFRITAVFDNDQEMVGKEVAGCMVYSMQELGKIIQEYNVKIAILSVPAHVAQEVTNNLVAVGIEGILNFAPVQLAVPEYVMVEDVHIVHNLLVLNYLTTETRNKRKGK